MDKTLSRRSLIGRAGLALGGAMTLGVLQSCSSEDDPAPIDPNCPEPDPCPDTAALIKQYPYEQHLTAGYQLDVAAVQEAAYHAYYNGGCCHGAYSALLGHLASTVGPPFSLLPIDFGKFGRGGIALYGSICGAVLGSQLIVNMIIADYAKREQLIVELMRWYEGFAFPAYVPQQVDAKEFKTDGSPATTKDFSAGNIANLQVIPGSHLCHPSVTTWCKNAAVSATSADKLARCARLTADVAGHAAALMNDHLAGNAFTPLALDAESNRCGTCHDKTKASPASVQSGLACTSCHPTQTADAGHYPTVK